MSVIIEQIFLGNRFHATRWNQNPFEDAHGEWPPSPWRLLRALLARWFEYQRETGVNNTTVRDSLLTKLAEKPPGFYLPPTAIRSHEWPSRGIKQYQPTSLEKSDKGADQPWVKRAQTTLVVDTFVHLSSDKALIWMWEDLALSSASPEAHLLDQLLRRITYFGRAESISRLRRLPGDEAHPKANVILTADDYGASPVLVPDPSQPLDVVNLLASTDDKIMKGRRIPPGTTWWYARRPGKTKLMPSRPAKELPATSVVQFAVGGRVFPKTESWIRLVENFRREANRCLAQIVLDDRRAIFRNLSSEDRSKYSLFFGKDLMSNPLEGHRHIRIFLLPDPQSGNPFRLICFRKVSFDASEQEALYRASENPIAWESGNADWRLRLVPISSKTPSACLGSGLKWRTVTPYVPTRHLLDRNGKPRAGRSIENEIANELVNLALPEAAVNVRDSHQWVKVHRTNRGDKGPTNDLKRGYNINLKFSSSVEGPIALGHSSHFGLGLFVPDDNT